MDAEDMLHPLHVRNHGKPKDRPHHRRISRRNMRPRSGCSTSRRTTSTGARRHRVGLGHSYVVYGPMANGATVVMCEGAPDWPKKIVLGDCRTLRRPRSSIPRRRPFARSCAGAPTGHPGATCQACGCSDRLVNRSILKRGSGNTAISAASGARWWTHGGRPRPARS